MSNDRAFATSPPIPSVESLVAGFREAEKPAALHRIGIEHEKLIHQRTDGRPASYEGASGIGALLEGLVPLGYEPLYEGNGADARLVALRRGQSTVSLEPGGQLEFSGSPFVSAAEAHAEHLEHLGHLRPVLSKLGLVAVALGYRPFTALEEVPFMPRSRFACMRSSLPQYGAFGSNMMRMTASVQVSLDWEDEADCARKIQVLARLTPLLVALYANSPLADGRPAPCLSFRSHIWEGVDRTRCGYLPSMLDGTFSYGAYVEWALDANVLFVRRGDRYEDPKRTFRQLLAEGWAGEPVRFADWDNHISTLFPEVRIKRVLEVRGPDCVDAELTGALAALLRGLLYDSTALQNAKALLPALTMDEQLAFHRDARRVGLAGRLGARSFAALANELVEVARDGLRRLDPADAPLLDPLQAVVRSGRSPAEGVLEAFNRGATATALHAACTV